jgi:hypothetical protein
MDGLMISRKIAPFGVAATLAFPGMSAIADDYRAEVRLSGQRVDLDNASDDIDVIGATGTYYLEPVRTDGLPLAEAAFLGRSSFVSAGAARSELGDEKIDILSASFGYYVPNTIFYGRLGIAYLDDFSPGDRSIVNGTFGVTPFDGLLLTTDFDEDGWDPNIAAKYVGKLANSHYYAVTASAVDPDGGDTAVGVDFDYFLDLTFKVGGGFNSGDDRFTIRAEKFFTPSFAVGGSLFTGDEVSGFGAQVAWRF